MDERESEEKLRKLIRKGKGKKRESDDKRKPGEEKIYMNKDEKMVK